MPSILEIFSYILYFPTSLCGPSCEFVDFKNFIYFDKEYKNIPWKKCNKLGSIDFILSLGCLLIVILLAKIFPAAYCGTEEYINQSILYKYIYFVLSMMTSRARYYVAWKMSQASCIFSGLSYSDEHGDKIDNCNLYNIEINLNVRTRIQFWNRSVHLWLKYHVYMRLINIETKPFKNNKSLASLITFMISACWHGFYPVYYIFFFLYYLIEQCASALEDKLDFYTWIRKQNIILRLIWWVFIMSMVNYFGNVFVLLKVNLMWNFFRAFYHIPTIILFSSYYYLCIYLKKPKSHKSE
jgi:lysophospholipid acyltransferase